MGHLLVVGNRGLYPYDKGAANGGKQRSQFQWKRAMGRISSEARISAFAEAVETSQCDSLLEISGDCSSAISEKNAGPEETNQPEDGRVLESDEGFFRRGAY